MNPFQGSPAGRHEVSDGLGAAPDEVDVGDVEAQAKAEAKAKAKSKSKAKAKGKSKAKAKGKAKGNAKASQDDADDDDVEEEAHGKGKAKAKGKAKGKGKASKGDAAEDDPISATPKRAIGAADGVGDGSQEDNASLKRAKVGAKAEDDAAGDDCDIAFGLSDQVIRDRVKAGRFRDLFDDLPDITKEAWEAQHITIVCSILLFNVVLAHYLACTYCGRTGPTHEHIDSTSHLHTRLIWLIISQ